MVYSDYDIEAVFKTRIIFGLRKYAVIDCNSPLKRLVTDVRK